MKKLFKSKTFLGAVMSIALCVSLIAGATFAIFTSEAKVNIAVTSGKVNVTATVDNLKLYSLENIDLATLTGTEKERTEEGTFINGGTAGLVGNALTLDRLTPGDKVTFDVNIANESNVTVKYRMRISIADDTGLANQLNIKIGDYAGRYVTIWEELAPGEGNQTLACEIGLPATSTVQDKSCTISLLVEAVQGNVAVSNDEHYPATSAELKEAMQYGGKVFMEKDVAIDPVVEDTTVNKLVPQTTVSNDTTIDLNGKTIGVKYDETTDFGNATPLLIAVMSGKLTLNGNGGINCEAGDQPVYGINVNGGSVVINGGNYYGAITAVQVQKGSLEINGGFFDMAPTCKVQFPQYAKYVVNCIDAAYKDGTATVTIKGGTFVNFDPSANPEGEGTSYVADGYSVISQDQENGDVWYTVVKGTGIVAETQDDLNAGITESTTKDVTVVVPKNSTVTIDSGIANDGSKARDVVFEGDGSQTVDVITNAVSAEGGQLNYQRGSTFTFKNLTIQGGEGSFDGIVCDELVYENCVIKGKLTLYGKATFINCTFENTMENQYSIWTWGGTDVTFENCTFNTNGKAILLYGQATAAKPTNLTVNNCIFNDSKNGAAGKAAIEIGNDYNATYNLVVNNATVNGFAAGKNTGSTLWANKNSMDAEHLSVTVDGTKVL